MVAILSRGRWVKIAVCTISAIRFRLQCVKSKFILIELQVYCNHEKDTLWGKWQKKCLLTLLALKSEFSRITRSIPWLLMAWLSVPPGGRFKNTYELLNQRALKFSYENKIHIFQCMGKIFCVEFQRYPLKFHTKYLTHTLKDMIFMQFWNFKSS